MPDIAIWDVGNAAVWRERVDKPPTGATLSLRHPTYPAEKNDWDGTNLEELREFVTTYLSKVCGALDLPLLFSSDAKFGVDIAWLEWPDGTGDPRHTFWVTRSEDPLGDGSTPLLDRSMVFVAAEAWHGNDSRLILGSRMGLRVVAHLRKQDSGKWKVRITSVARSAGLPDALSSSALEPATVTDFYTKVFTAGNLVGIKDIVRKFAGLSSDTPVAIDGAKAITVAGESSATIYATASRPPNAPQVLPYALVLRFRLVPGVGMGTPTVEKSPLVAHALPPVKADLFTQDPASAAGLGGLIESRPNRSPERLDAFKKRDVVLEGITLVAGAATLADDLGLVDVLQSGLADRNANEKQTEIVDPTDAEHARLKEFSALSGYEGSRARFDDRNLRPLFDTLIAYGLSPDSYFRFAAIPVQLRHRARITPGPGKDGKTVNAQVDFDPPYCSLIAEPKPWSPVDLRSLVVRFALADLKRTASRRHALGLAADPRWSWHEYCHVLLAAQTGRLEMHFAHSAGDALAAIVADPWSKLVKYPWLRGYTFPWAYLHRRHDREIRLGWGWSGRRHRQSRFPAVGSNSRHKGYDSEQILSTTLFRLYRALGGDTDNSSGNPNRDARQRAADYTTYLILRAIRTIPAHYASVVETPTQFETLLIDADVATWPAASGPLAGRAGGWAHKVVRWAFESQGLHATTNPMEVLDTPGLPPPIDIFIDTGRPDSEGIYDRGGYMPVSLDWRGAGIKAWHAEANALRIDAAGQIRVDVRNRGQNPATNVGVSLWYIVRPDTATKPPNWNPSTWTKIADSNLADVPPWPAVAVTFGPFAPPPAQPSGTRVWILAIADCAGDRANTDQETVLPCSLNPTSIVDLVAGDNNLGLRVLG